MTTCVRSSAATGARSSALVEFVDVYPTLCELAGLPSPDHLEGISFAPLLDEPQRDWKEALLSRYQAGDSIRTDRYLYTEWTDDEGERTAQMLYDHRLDPEEDRNIAVLSENGEVVEQLAGMLRKGWEAYQLT